LNFRGGGFYLDLEPRDWCHSCPVERDKVMVATSIILPYEPGYVANKEADKRRKETKERLQQREREFAERQPPSIVPERLRASSVGGFVTVEVSKSAHTAQASA
jgi:hypothetical protein